MSGFDADDIRRYYDRHTAGFLALGQGGGAGVIHRAVWGPGVTERQDAFHYVDSLIADLAHPLIRDSMQPLYLVDLGCGVAASLCYLAERLPIRGTGVTLSPVQCRIAAERIARAGLADRVRCVEGDYTALPDSIAGADVAYAIESFVHGPSPERFFAESHRLLRPGGLLVICDDFARPTENPAATRMIDRFRRGWQVNSLLSQDTLRSIAEAAGFRRERIVDLSPWLELCRPRDRAVSAIAAAIVAVSRAAQVVAGDAGPRWLTQRYGHLVGGSALQTCLVEGWIGYDFVVFTRL